MSHKTSTLGEQAVSEAIKEVWHYETKCTELAVSIVQSTGMPVLDACGKALALMAEAVPLEALAAVSLSPERLRWKVTHTLNGAGNRIQEHVDVTHVGFDREARGAKRRGAHAMLTLQERTIMGNCSHDFFLSREQVVRLKNLIMGRKDHEPG
jgi:hypothetical protein